MNRAELSHNLSQNHKNSSLNQPDLSQLPFKSDLPSPIQKTEEKNDEYFEDFEHLSELDNPKTNDSQRNNKEKTSESLLLNDLDLKSNEENTRKTKKIEQKHSFIAEKPKKMNKLEKECNF